jgi:hypothetical protein
MALAASGFWPVVGKKVSVGESRHAAYAIQGAVDQFLESDRPVGEVRCGHQKLDVGRVHAPKCTARFS